MKTALILGPNFWRSRWRRDSPLHLRALVKATLRSEDIDGILMEDLLDQADEDRYPDQKFKRLLDTLDLAAVIVVWPPKAKMQTVFIELVILAQRGLEGLTLPLYYLAHPKAASHQNGRFIIHERGGPQHVHQRRRTPCPDPTPLAEVNRVADGSTALCP